MSDQIGFSICYCYFLLVCFYYFGYKILYFNVLINYYRYFECAPKFGLFAPISKVSLSPSSSRRPSCAVHHTPIKKQGSYESLNSVASTASVKSAARVRLGVTSLAKVWCDSLSYNLSVKLFQVNAQFNYPTW